MEDSHETVGDSELPAVPFFGPRTIVKDLTFEEHKDEKMLQASKLNAIESDIYDDCDSNEENVEHSTTERHDNIQQSTPVSLTSLTLNNN